MLRSGMLDSITCQLKFAVSTLLEVGLMLCTFSTRFYVEPFLSFLDNASTNALSHSLFLAPNEQTQPCSYHSGSGSKCSVRSLRTQKVVCNNCNTQQRASNQCLNCQTFTASSAVYVPTLQKMLHVHFRQCL
jgi:hypothetical protein